MDHQYSSYNIRNEEWLDIKKEEIIMETDYGNATDTNIYVPDKTGDDYLIKLYRERKFLYDKKNRDFRDNKLKNNAWKEISTIMVKYKNFGNYYTAEYCKKRITTLREQYSKLMRKNELISESAGYSKKKSSLLSQLSFLRKHIQRRRNFTNTEKDKNAQISAIFFNKNAAALQETKVAESDDLKRKFETSSSSQGNTEYDSTDDSIFYEKSHKTMKKKRATKNDKNDTLPDLTNAAVDICTQLKLNSTSHRDVSSKSAEQAFSQFIAFSLQAMEEPERSIRRNKIFQDLTTPIDQFI
nr:PREDICTED: uncharacterized protein LOC105669427 [Linepithema humile]XP_012217813.1 PREDICTED: uncharacterized protein LOC105669427 [Linepithema humile]XP_012217814.1 PREDICTED: uncharacterized protein LOC105669427 [Linepithema humile]